MAEEGGLLEGRVEAGDIERKGEGNCERSRKVWGLGWKREGRRC